MRCLICAGGTGGGADQPAPPHPAPGPGGGVPGAVQRLTGRQGPTRSTTIEEEDALDEHYEMIFACHGLNHHSPTDGVMVTDRMPYLSRNPEMSTSVPMVTPIDPVQQFRLAMIWSAAADT